MVPPSNLPVLDSTAGPSTASPDHHGLLRREPAYWHTFTTSAKMRWYNRRILDVLVEEFRDRTKHYYTWAIHQGLLKINGEPVLPDHIVRNGDLITHTAHKHEPPITSDPVRVLYRNDEEGRLVVVKPGSVPVHPAGRYLRHTLLELIKTDYGIDKVFTANRLDRLTSGIMVASTTTAAAKELASDFESGRVRKAYVCRVQGRFPEDETICEEPLLSLDRQTGVVIAHPLGREAKTIFNRLSYDEETDTSVLFCRPITGRTHQIRVHAQLLGHVIPNDPIYAHPIWTEYLATSLKDIPIPSDFGLDGNGGVNNTKHVAANVNAAATKYLASTPACAAIIESLKNSKDEGEDWSRLKDELRFAQWNKENGWKEGESVGGINAGPAQGVVGASAEEDEGGYCKDCFLPLLPDPPAEALFIYLHAIRYETDSWSFEDEMPWWARDNWKEPDAMSKAQQARERGEVVRPPRLQLVSEVEGMRKQVAEKQDQSVNGGRPSKESQTVRTPGSADGAEERPPDDMVVISPGAGELRTPPVFAPLLECKPLPGTVAPPSAIIDALAGVPLVLETFRGLEDFTLRDLHTRLDLPSKASTSSIQTAVHSGHLLIPPDAAESIVQLFPLPFVSATHILIGLKRLPEDLLDQLLSDRRELGTCKLSRANQKAKAKKATIDAQGSQRNATDSSSHLKKPPAEVVERTQDGRVASEVRLLAFIQDLWNESSSAIDVALSAWRRYALASGHLPPGEERWSYRASVERSVYKLPTLVSSDICGHVGECVWSTLNGPIQKDEDPPHPVSLKMYALDVVCSLVPWLDPSGSGTSQGPVVRLGEERRTYGKAWDTNPPGSVMFSIKLSEGPFRPRMLCGPNNASLAQGRGESEIRDGDGQGEEGSTALARHRAYTLASLLPLPLPLPKEVDASQANPPNLKIWEPCVGTGSIAVELSSILSSRHLRGVVFGSDIEEDNILCAIRRRKRRIDPTTTRGSTTDGGEDPEGGGVEIRYSSVDLRDEGKVLEFLNIPYHISHPPSSPSSSSSLLILEEDEDSLLLDGIVVDLPWGRRELSHVALLPLYRAFLQVSLLVLKPWRYIVALTLEHRSLQRALLELEGVVRRKGVGGGRWIIRMQRLSLGRRECPEGGGKEEEEEGEEERLILQGIKQAEELGGGRTVEMGLRPAVYLLRKVPL